MMNCQDVELALPWLLNGSLSEQESVDLYQHMQQCSACREQLSQVRTSYELFDSHPSSEELLRHVEGRSRDDDERRSVEAHLAYCPICADARACAQQSLAAEGADILTFDETKANVDPSTPWRLIALAASLLWMLTVVAWFARVTAEPGAESGSPQLYEQTPRGDVQVIDLPAADRRVRSSTGPSTLPPRIVQSRPVLFLISWSPAELDALHLQPGDLAHLEISCEGGGQWSLHATVAEPADLAVQFSNHVLPVGNCTVLVQGTDQTLNYSFSVQAPSPTTTKPDQK